MPSQPEIPIEVRHELTRLRAIMYEPSSVWLATWQGHERWLTDGYVMVVVTGSKALVLPDAPMYLDAPNDPDAEWLDGGYKLVASRGLEPRESVPEPDLDAYFKRMDELCDWYRVAPSEWSVADHPGKAQLWIYDATPCLLGESTWTSLTRHHPGCLVEYSPEQNVFRFSDELPFCFAAGIRVPEGQEEIAKSIARMEDDS